MSLHTSVCTHFASWQAPQIISACVPWLVSAAINTKQVAAQSYAKGMRMVVQVPKEK
jgi:hypothetical protein